MFCARAYSSVLLIALAVVSTAAQSVRPHAAAISDLRSVRVTPGEFGPVVEVQSSHPLTPKVQVVEQPLRLVIDLPDSTLGNVRPKIPFRNEQIKSVRLSQYQNDPAVTRIVLDLAAPVLYTWDAAGNQLRIRIRADQSATAKPPSVPAFTAGVEPVAVPVAVGTSGSLVETGSRVASGASITAGDQTAVLRLTRGGEVPRGLPWHHGFRRNIEQWARPDAGHKQGRHGDPLQRAGVSRFCSHSGFSYCAARSGRVQPSHQYRLERQHLRGIDGGKHFVGCRS